MKCWWHFVLPKVNTILLKFYELHKSALEYDTHIHPYIEKIPKSNTQNLSLWFPSYMDPETDKLFYILRLTASVAGWKSLLGIFHQFV